MAVFGVGRYNTVLLKIIDNQLLKNQTETRRNGNIRRHETERQNAGNQTAVDLQTVHERQQRRNEHRNEGDVHRKDVLRGHSDAGQHQKEPAFFLTDDFRHSLRKRGGKSRVHHGGGKRSEQNITQRRFSVVSHPANERIHHGFNRNARANPRRQSGDEQSEQDVSFLQTKDIQNNNGNNDGVRKQSHTRKILRQEKFLGKKKTCGQRKEERNAFELS